MNADQLDRMAATARRIVTAQGPTDDSPRPYDELGGQVTDGACSCRDGWLGTDDHPVPCPRCRPHLRRTTDPRTGVTAWNARKTP